MRERRVSVGVYLGAAFGVTIAALTAVVAYSSVSGFHRERVRAVERARSAARLVAIGYGREIAETPAQASSIVEIPEIAGTDLAACNEFMQKFLEWPAGHVSVVAADGSVRCSTDPRALGLGRPYGGAAWLAEAVAGKETVLTEPARDVVTGKVGVATVVPFSSTDGRPSALLLASDMPNFLTLTMPELRMGSEIVVLDRGRSMILDRSIRGAEYSGRSILAGPLAAPIPTDGAIRRGVDGIERVYAAQTVEGSGWHVLSGIATSVAFADARAQRNRSIALGSATVLMVSGLGLLLHRRLAKPIGSLTRAIEASASDPAAFAPEEGPAEIARVATTFNEVNEKRRRSEDRFRALVMHASDLIVVLDGDGVVRYCSPAAQRLVGRADPALVGEPFTSNVLGEDRERVAVAFGAAARRPGVGDPIEFRVRHSDGSVRQVEALLNNLADDPSVGGIVVTVRDMTERKAFEEHLAHQALHDPLTDLPNRALVLDRLTHALARTARAGGTIGVLFMDLDRFKLVNDSHGHAVGDRILVMLADRLQREVRPGDTVARFGGDEFVTVCENLSDERDALEVAARMSATLRDPFPIEGQELFLSGSVGIAMSGRGETAEDLLRNADAAMYRAKETGRSGHAVFDDAMRTRAMSRIQIEAALHRAIDSKGFVLHFQPKVSLADGRVVGAEGLVRMVGPDGALVQPSEFIEVAEETGLIVPIGEIVLLEACRAAREWQRPGPAVPVSVNLSPRQLAQPNLPEVVERILAESGLEPGLLVLEITENLLMLDAPLAARTLGRLRAVGVRVSIDDFGTGHSSLGYLRSFPIDELKIDRSFIDAIEQDPRSATIVGSVVGLAHAMELTVVAEGVETAAQLSELRRLGCDEAQGFYFSHPRPAEAVGELLGSDVLWGAPRPLAGRPA